MSTLFQDLATQKPEEPDLWPFWSIPACALLGILMGPGFYSLAGIGLSGLGSFIRRRLMR